MFKEVNRKSAQRYNNQREARGWRASCISRDSRLVEGVVTWTIIGVNKPVSGTYGSTQGRGSEGRSATIVRACRKGIATNKRKIRAWRSRKIEVRGEETVKGGGKTHQRTSEGKRKKSQRRREAGEGWRKKAGQRFEGTIKVSWTTTQRQWKSC